MQFNVQFTESKQSFNPSFGIVNNVSDGGFERGYAAALDNRTELTVTENGEYAPTEDSTGFKNVIVNVMQSGGLVCDSGSFVTPSDVATITIQHKSAATPSLFYIWSETKNTKSIFVTGAAIYSPKTSAYMTQGLGYNSSGAATALTGSNNVVNANQNEVTLKVHTAYSLKSGETYHWMATKQEQQNRSIFATQFSVLEDFTVDGTITGELDESKI